MPLTPDTDIELREISLRELAAAALSGGGSLQALRSAHRPLLLLSRLPPLRWGSALLVAPHGCVWCDFPAGTTTALHLPEYPTCGPHQALWIARISGDRAVRRGFKQALDAAGVGALPRGVLGFDGGILNGATAIGIDRKQAPLWPGWHRAYLLPDVEQAPEALLQAARAVLAERREFAMRPLTDDAVLQAAAAEPYSLADSRPEAMLLSQIYADPHPLGKPPEAAARIVAALQAALDGKAAESPLNFRDCSATLGPATGLQLPIADHSHSRVMDIPRRTQDEIVSLRLELVQRLGWPVFARQLLVARQQLLARRSGSRPFGPLPFDPVASVEAYLRRVGQTYPTSLGWPFDSVWARA